MSTRTPIKVLHIASFDGNIGDNASHNGFRRKLEDTARVPFSYTNVEIRKFYQSWGDMSFNSADFIDMCNSHDVVVFGGGNFFELKWDYSSTGTTIDLSAETLGKIRTPILFNGIGCDVAKGTTRENLAKFEAFLEIVTGSPKYLVCLRDDGSREVIHGFLPERICEHIQIAPDNGFLMKSTGDCDMIGLLSSGRRLIGVNVCVDMKDVRWSNPRFSYEDYLQEISSSINGFLSRHDEYDIVFVPHIFSDLAAISDICRLLNDRYRRLRIFCAPYTHGQGVESSMFGIYRKCDFVLSMRFHGNVCPISMNVPTVALSCYPKIEKLYDILKLEKRVIRVNEPFANSLITMMDSTVAQHRSISESYSQVNQRIAKSADEYFDRVNNWMNSNGIFG